MWCFIYLFGVSPVAQGRVEVRVQRGGQHPGGHLPLLPQPAGHLPRLHPHGGHAGPQLPVPQGDLHQVGHQGHVRDCSRPAGRRALGAPQLGRRRGARERVDRQEVVVVGSNCVD
eukprot:3380704-Pyramimonas_sp.AAC.1